MLGATVMELLRPWPLKIVFDVLLQRDGDSSGYLVGLQAALGGIEGLLVAVVLSILVIAALAGLFRYGQTYHAAAVGQRVVGRVRHQLYGHIQRLSHSFHDSNSTGDLLARLTGDIHRMRDLLVNSVIFLSDRLLMLVGMLAVMMWMDWQLTAVALVIVPLLAFTVSKFTTEIKGATRSQRRRESRITTAMTEKLSAIRVVKAFAREAHEDELFSKSVDKEVRAGLRTKKLEGKLNRLVEVILAGGTAGVVWLGVGRVQAGSLTPGDLLVFTHYVAALYKPIRRLSALTSRLAKAAVCGERIVSILEIEPEIKDAADAVEAPSFEGDLVFENVSFGYRPGVPILRDVSFHIKPGQTVALVGESGAGKSTIADLLLRFYDPDEGRILVDGTDIRRYTLNSLREQMSVVLQETILFNATVRDNITYGDLDASQEDIERAAEVAYAGEFIEALPEGYETTVGERGVKLSGGERQRIAITRAVICDSPILVLDEPMSGLDAESEEKVQRAIKSLMRERTTLLITHDQEVAEQADVVLRISGGRIVACDATERERRRLHPIADPTPQPERSGRRLQLKSEGVL